MALTDIADAQGDVDAFIAQYDSETRKVPRIAAEIAQRLLPPAEQRRLQTIDAAEHKRSGWPDFEWEDARIDALEALERSDDAQAARWSCFERFLSARHLREYLKRLPDFDDIEAETRALDYAESLAELVGGADRSLRHGLRPIARRNFVLGRTEELDGDRYEVLTPVADASGRQTSAGGDAGAARDDRVLSRSRPIQSIQARRSPFSGMRQSRFGNFGFWKMGDA